jgi:hypothetical protein
MLGIDEERKPEVNDGDVGSKAASESFKSPAASSLIVVFPERIGLLHDL